MRWVFAVRSLPWGCLGKTHISGCSVAIGSQDTVAGRWQVSYRGLFGDDVRAVAYKIVSCIALSVIIAAVQRAPWLCNRSYGGQLMGPGSVDHTPDD